MVSPVIPTESYVAQSACWPVAGRHILACADETSLIVYQAFRGSVAERALSRQDLAVPGFGLRRTSWIKTNFLWMMHRSSWGTAQGQERVLAIRVGKAFFDSLLSAAVASAYREGDWESRDQWRDARRRADVVIQWDPDHDPSGARLARRAIQLGLRRHALLRYATHEVIEVIDVTTLALAQAWHAYSGCWSELETPMERVYLPADAEVRAAIGLDDHSRGEA